MAAAESTPSAIAAVFCVKELQLPRARSPSEGVSGVERVEVAQTQQSRVEWLANQNKTSLE